MQKPLTGPRNLTERQLDAALNTYEITDNLPATNDCPPLTALALLASGRLERNDARRIQGHVLVCDRCAALYREAATYMEEEANRAPGHAIKSRIMSSWVAVSLQDLFYSLRGQYLRLRSSRQYSIMAPLAFAATCVVFSCFLLQKQVRLWFSHQVNSSQLANRSGGKPLAPMPNGNQTPEVLVTPSSLPHMAHQSSPPIMRESLNGTSPVKRVIRSGKNQVAIMEHGFKIILSKDGKYRPAGTSDIYTGMIEQAIWSAPYPSLLEHVQQAGPEIPTEALFLKSPIGEVVFSTATLAWNPLSTRLPVKRYIVRYQRINTGESSISTNMVETQVPQGQTQILPKHLESGEYKWLVSAVIQGRRESDTIDSAWAHFVVVPEQYRESNLIKGLAYARFADKRIKAEQQFNKFRKQQEQIGSTAGVKLAQAMLGKLRQSHERPSGVHGNN